MELNAWSLNIIDCSNNVAISSSPACGTNIAIISSWIPLSNFFWLKSLTFFIFYQKSFNIKSSITWLNFWFFETGFASRILSLSSFSALCVETCILLHMKPTLKVNNNTVILDFQVRIGDFWYCYIIFWEISIVRSIPFWSTRLNQCQWYPYF